MGRVLPREFYERDPRIVAEDLLGRVLERRTGKGVARCRIVETEAYLGPEDPGSRASMHRGGRIVARLRGPAGLLLVYGVHAHWMLNIVSHPPGGVGAVLLRACEPLEIPWDAPLPVGPGRLSRALLVDRSLDGAPVYEPGAPLVVLDGKEPVRVARSHRIGLRRDADEPLRFCVEGSRFISAPCR